MGKTSVEKTILHIDGDAFFVGVEIAKNPKLKGLPVVTGEERGIVTALSYEAKALGITRGMPVYRVKKYFPKVIVLAGDYRSYAKYSSLMFGVVRRYVDDVEEYSIDECFGDLTGLERSLKMTYRQIAERIKKEVNEELGLSVSIGVAPTKVLAKVASKWVKPNGLTIIEKEKICDFLIKTPIGKVWGIGPRTAEVLIKKGIHTANDFIKMEEGWIRRSLPKPYNVIWAELRGVYSIVIDSEPKTVYSSIQKTRTFYPPTNSKDFLLSQLSKHVEEACLKARHFGLAPRKISFFLKTSDFDFHTSHFLLISPTNAPEIIFTLIEKSFDTIHRSGVLYRTAGVTLNDLIVVTKTQGDLFGSNTQMIKFESVHQQIDSLERKFGKKVIYLASTQNALKRRAGGTDMEDLDRDLLFL